MMFSINQYKIEISGQWTDWLTNTTEKEAVFPPQDVILLNGKTYYFRSRARDANGLWEDYPGENEGDAHTKVVLSGAMTIIEPLPKIHTSKTFTVKWSGVGAVAYNVQYKKGKAGTWVNWVSNTTQTSKEFTGIDGATYYFRCCGKDSQGIWAGYPLDEAIDTYTTISLSSAPATASTASSSAPATNVSDMENTVDLVLSSLGFSTSVKGQPIILTVRVRNNSKVAVEGCILEITADDGFNQKQMFSVKENYTEMVKIKWEPKKSGKITITAEVKAPEKYVEKNLLNNILKKQIMLKELLH